MNHQFLKICDVLFIDHLAVTTPVFNQTLSEYLCLAGSRLLRGPAINPSQNVEYAFVQLQGGITVEILGVKECSPIAGHVAKGGGPNHICYAVADIDGALAKASNAGARIIVSPTSDVAFDGRRIAFLFYESLGVIEFVEAFPPVSKIGGSFVSGSESGLSAHDSPVSQNSVKVIADKLNEELIELFKGVFPKLNMSEIQNAKYNISDGWDSLNHIRLIMAIEEKFNLEVSPEEFATLSTYVIIRNWIADKM